MNSSRRRILLVIAGLFTFGSLTVLAYATGPIPEEEAEETHQAFVDAAPAADIEAFGIIAPSESAKRELPEAVPEALEGSLNSVLAPDDRMDIQYGMATLETGTEVMVAGNSHALCMTDAVDGSGVATCAPLADAASGKMITASICMPDLVEEKIRVLGLAPDGVQSVAIDYGVDGLVDMRVPVTENMYEADVPAVRASFSDANGEVATFATTQPLNKWGLPQGENCMRSAPSS
jgi:hypothetical protein